MQKTKFKTQNLNDGASQQEQQKIAQYMVYDIFLLHFKKKTQIKGSYETG